MNFRELIQNFRRQKLVSSEIEVTLDSRVQPDGLEILSKFTLTPISFLTNGPKKAFELMGAIPQKNKDLVALMEEIMKEAVSLKNTNKRSKLVANYGFAWEDKSFVDELQRFPRFVQEIQFHGEQDQYNPLRNRFQHYLEVSSADFDLDVNKGELALTGKYRPIFHSLLGDFSYVNLRLNEDGYSRLLRSLSRKRISLITERSVRRNIKIEEETVEGQDTIFYRLTVPAKFFYRFADATTHSLIDVNVEEELFGNILESTEVHYKKEDCAKMMADAVFLAKKIIDVDIKVFPGVSNLTRATAGELMNEEFELIERSYIEEIFSEEEVYLRNQYLLDMALELFPREAYKSMLNMDYSTLVTTVANSYKIEYQEMPPQDYRGVFEEILIFTYLNSIRKSDPDKVINYYLDYYTPEEPEYNAHALIRGLPIGSTLPLEGFPNLFFSTYGLSEWKGLGKGYMNNGISIGADLSTDNRTHVLSHTNLSEKNPVLLEIQNKVFDNLGLRFSPI